MMSYWGPMTLMTIYVFWTSFFCPCEECNTRTKLEKCAFMQEEIEYFGFQVGWRWWPPVKEKVAPISKASIRDDKTRGGKDIRAFL